MSTTLQQAATPAMPAPTPEGVVLSLCEVLLRADSLRRRSPDSKSAITTLIERLQEPADLDKRISDARRGAMVWSSLTVILYGVSLLIAAGLADKKLWSQAIQTIGSTVLFVGCVVAISYSVAAFIAWRDKRKALRRSVTRLLQQLEDKIVELVSKLRSEVTDELKGDQAFWTTLLQNQQFVELVRQQLINEPTLAPHATLIVKGRWPKIKADVKTDISATSRPPPPPPGQQPQPQLFSVDDVLLRIERLL